MSTSEKQEKITLVSNDGISIEVGKMPRSSPPRGRKLTAITDRNVAERSMLIKNMMDDLGEGAVNTEVPIPNVSSS